VRAAADEVVHGLAVAMAEDGQRMAVREDVLRGAVAHEPDPDIADTKLAHCARTPA
jgi:hypothetical protein